MTYVFRGLAALGSFLLMYFVGLALIGLALKITYLSLLAGWNLI